MPRSSTSLHWLRTPAAAVLVATLLAASGCGSGGGLSLSIEGPEAFNTASESAILRGEGFVPPGSSCTGRGTCGPFAPPVLGSLGQYELRWSNLATGQSGNAVTVHPVAFDGLIVCNCLSGIEFTAQVPLAPGPNRIVITQTAGAAEASDEVVITRQ
jgi:hypothetical protein